MGRYISNKVVDRSFKWLGYIVTGGTLLILFSFIGFIAWKGLARIDIGFLTNITSRFPEKAGIRNALFGSVMVLILSGIIAIPLGIAAGIYLEEYSKKGWLSYLLELNISNLAGVPSVIFGILGLQIFVSSLGFGKVLFSGACTLALVILPTIIITTREAIRLTPDSIRLSSYGLGASKWQTIRNAVLPYASRGILTGIILSLSRVIGETAPLIIIGAVGYLSYKITSPFEPFTVLPIKIYEWIQRSDDGFLTNATSAIFILLIITFMLNGIAIFLRYKWLENKK